MQLVFLPLSMYYIQFEKPYNQICIYNSYTLLYYLNKFKTYT